VLDGAELLDRFTTDPAGWAVPAVEVERLL
jgi:hypothetical protein